MKTHRGFSTSTRAHKRLTHPRPYQRPPTRYRATTRLLRPVHSTVPRDHSRPRPQYRHTPACLQQHSAQTRHDQPERLDLLTRHTSTNAQCAIDTPSDHSTSPPRAQTSAHVHAPTAAQHKQPAPPVNGQHDQLARATHARQQEQPTHAHNTRQLAPRTKRAPPPVLTRYAQAQHGTEQRPQDTTLLAIT